MKNEFYIDTKDLPSELQNGLTKVGYTSKSIRVSVESDFEPRPPSADGRRGFLAAVPLDGSEVKVTWGSWGGSNMFTKTVDDVEGTLPVPNNMAFIRGYGDAGKGYPAYATIIVGPDNINKSWLPSGGDVSEREAKILAIFRSLKSAYRKEYLDLMKAEASEVDSLVARGFLSRNAVGATAITTKGRNSAASNYY